MFVYGCTFVFLCISTGVACVCVGGGGETRKDVTCEALQKAGQIIPGNPCIHVSALWVWGLQRERVKARRAISGHAVSVSCDSVWSQLLLCLLPNLPTVIHPAWHGVLVTAMPNPPRCQEEHSIPSTDRVYWLPCLLIAISEAISYYPFIGLTEVLFSLPWLCIQPTDDI